MSQVLLGLFIILFVPIGASVAYASMSTAPWIPSRKSTRDLLRSLTIPNGSTLLELGCGDGRVLFDLARLHPHSQFIGYEISLPVFLLSYLRSFTKRNVTIRYRSIYNIKEKPTHIYIFLLPDAYARLEKSLLNLSPGTIVYTNIWPLPNRLPNAVHVSTNSQKLYETIV